MTFSTVRAGAVADLVKGVPVEGASAQTPAVRDLQTAGAKPASGAPSADPRVEGTPGGGSSTASARPERPVGERRPERRPRVEEGTASGPSPSTGAGEQRRPRPPAAAGSRPRTPTGPVERGPAGARPPAGARSSAPSAARRTPPRFEPGTAHREVLLAGLAPEQRPIAERLAAGGIPAVRRAIAEERERARAEGRPEVSGEAILALAEQLAASVKQAIWLDRAEAAVAQIEQISLRDLRTTVAAAAPRDEAARELDRKLREELDRRVKKLRSTWEEQISHALEEGRVLQALRFSAQPPEPTARFPAGLVERLAASAGAAMTASTPHERWLALLDAAAASPIRRQIHPEGLPEDPSGEVVRRARLAAGSIPALAPMIGLPMPPPPKPIRGARPPRPVRQPGRAPRPPAPPGSRKQAAPAGGALEAESLPGENASGQQHDAPAEPGSPSFEQVRRESEPDDVQGEPAGAQDPPEAIADEPPAHAAAEPTVADEAQNEPITHDEPEPEAVTGDVGPDTPQDLTPPAELAPKASQPEMVEDESGPETTAQNAEADKAALVGGLEIASEDAEAERVADGAEESEPS